MRCHERLNSWTGNHVEYDVSEAQTEPDVSEVACATKVADKLHIYLPLTYQRFWSPEHRGLQVLHNRGAIQGKPHLIRVFAE